MRKLLTVPVLACLLVLPPALAAQDEREPDEIPYLVAVSSLQPAEQDGPSLISSSVAGDPLDHQEARDRLQAATRGAQRDLAREREASASEATVGTQATAAAPATSAPPAAPHLEAIAACESGGDPQAIGGGGAYRGKYQFSPVTWQAVGGTGDPASAPEAEQDRRAAILYAQSGPSQWPVCGG